MRTQIIVVVIHCEEIDSASLNSGHEKLNKNISVRNSAKEIAFNANETHIFVCSVCLSMRFLCVVRLFWFLPYDDNNRWRYREFCVRKFGIAEKSH